LDVAGSLVGIILLLHQAAATVGTWAGTRSMNVARFDHTATLLPN
jgi:hypothetical protein